jgi:hypothetical protein
MLKLYMSYMYGNQKYQPTKPQQYVLSLKDIIILIINLDNPFRWRLKNSPMMIESRIKSEVSKPFKTLVDILTTGVWWVLLNPS